MYAYKLLFVFLLPIITNTAPTKKQDGCGYQNCNLGDPNKLNVHIVSHTHDDVGWLKTVDQYFYGAQNNIQHAGVQYILDSVMLALDENPDRRFIYVEIGFFWRWWRQQTEEMQDKVRQFVSEGRLEFISGGWCMNDEASTHYNSIIDQHSLGAEFLRDQFGDCGRPKIGWQIDPFGHSREQASLMAQMGFDGLFFGRADFADIDQRNRTRTREMVWKASSSLGQQAWLFTGVLPNGYSPPDGFCFDAFCGDQPIMDDPKLHDLNVQSRVNDFIKAAHDEARGYATNHIIMTMGSDFQYENANEWFKNLDKLLKYVNAEQQKGSDVNVFYSTPSCYLYALNKAGRNWTSKTDDFFPYAHHPHGFWTGYFTSRAALKRYERHSNNILQVARQLNSVIKGGYRTNLFALSEAMGVAQHHDAVSGTEKQKVAFDYAQRLSRGIDAAEQVINTAYNSILPKQSSPPSTGPQFLCQLTNISECLPIQDQSRFTLTLWNPTIHQVLQHVRVPVTRGYTIRDPSGASLSADLRTLSNSTKNIPGRVSSAQYELVFRVMLPAMGYSTYFFEMKPMMTSPQPTKIPRKNDACILKNQNLQVEIDAQGNLQRMINLKKNINVTFTNQGFYWYESFAGNNSASEFQASGAYIFRPVSPTPTPVSQTRTIECINGENIQTAIVVFNEWTSQEITLYSDVDSVEVEWTVGPIPFDDQVGKEIIVRYDTDIKSNAKYYTDANGREVLERTRDYRPTWNYTVVETVSGNYYPINSRIWIKEDTRQFTVLTDRSQGGGSINDGSIEIMLHRRTSNDDALGVGENLNEEAFGTGLVVRGRHYLILETPDDSASKHRVMSQNLYMHPLATFSLTTLSYSDYSKSYRQTWSALNDTQPMNIHLLTLDQLDSNVYLVRLEHYFEIDEDTEYSIPTDIDLQSLFYSLGTITNTVELSLGANMNAADMQRLGWTTDDVKVEQKTQIVPRQLGDNKITLSPMQIRTFRVTVA